MNNHLFHLLRAAIGTEPCHERSLSSDEWRAMYRDSVVQGVTAVVFDFLKTLPKSEGLDKALLLEWLSAATAVEQTMRRMQMIAEEFAEEMEKRKIPVAVLKGMAFAQYYPNTLHRECGDMDCYMMGKKEAGDLAAVELGGKVEEAGYKHSHLTYEGLTIENHRFFTDFDNTQTGIMTEQILSQLMQERHTYIGNSKLHCPSANFNALFLLKHAQGHFIDEGIRMRHLLDWALFLKSKQEEVDWTRVLPMLEATHTAQFAGVMTAIASKLLRIDIHHKGLLVLAESAEQRMVDAVLADIMGEQPAIYVDGLWHKTKRILRRFYRMWKFRSLASESYPRMVWNAFAFSSYVSWRWTGYQQNNIGFVSPERRYEAPDRCTAAENEI